jgi:hypothetical protein
MSDRGRDPERMAAMLDGRLDAARRAELLAELDASPEDLELLADAAFVLGELGLSAPSDEPVEAPDAPIHGVRDEANASSTPPLADAYPADKIATEPDTIADPPSSAPATVFSSGGGSATEVIDLHVERTRRRGRGLKVLLPIAALLAGLAVIPFLRGRGDGTADPGLYAHQGSFGAAGLPAEWNRAPWSATRGSDDSLSPRARAVRLGVAITDLELAVGANDPRAAEIAGDVQRLLEPVPAAGAISQYYDGIAAGQVNGPAAKDAVRKARLAIARLPDGEMVSTGAWLEAARLAAVRGDGEFFASNEAGNRLGDPSLLHDLPQDAKAELQALGSAPARMPSATARQAVSALSTVLAKLGSGL